MALATPQHQPALTEKVRLLWYPLVAFHSCVVHIDAAFGDRPARFPATLRQARRNQQIGDPVRTTWCQLRDLAITGLRQRRRQRRLIEIRQLGGALTPG